MIKINLIALTYIERTLKEKIYSKLGLSNEQAISSPTYHFLVSLNPTAYSGIILFDDEDVQCMINSYQQQYFSNVIEIYVEIVDVGSSSIPTQAPAIYTQFSADTCWQPNTICVGGSSLPPQTRDFDDHFTTGGDKDINLGSDEDNDDGRDVGVLWLNFKNFNAIRRKTNPIPGSPITMNH